MRKKKKVIQFLFLLTIICAILLIVNNIEMNNELDFRVEDDQSTLCSIEKSVLVPIYGEKEGLVRLDSSQREIKKWITRRFGGGCARLN